MQKTFRPIHRIRGFQNPRRNGVFDMIDPSGRQPKLGKRPAIAEKGIDKGEHDFYDAHNHR